MIASDSATYSGHAEKGSPTGWVACSISAHREGEVLDALLRIQQDERSPEHALVVLGSRVDAEGPADLDPRRALVDMAVQRKQWLPLPDRLEHRGAPHGDHLQAPALDRGLEVLVELGHAPVAVLDRLRRAHVGVDELEVVVPGHPDRGGRAGVEPLVGEPYPTGEDLGHPPLEQLLDLLGG